MTEKWRNTVVPLKLPHEPNGEDVFGLYVYDFDPPARTLLMSSPNRSHLYSWLHRLPCDVTQFVLRVERLGESPVPFRLHLTYKGLPTQVREVEGTAPSIVHRRAGAEEVGAT